MPTNLPDKTPLTPDIQDGQTFTLLTGIMDFLYALSGGKNFRDGIPNTGGQADGENPILQRLAGMYANLNESAYFSITEDTTERLNFGFDPVTGQVNIIGGPVGTNPSLWITLSDLIPHVQNISLAAQATELVNANFIKNKIAVAYISATGDVTASNLPNNEFTAVSDTYLISPSISEFSTNSSVLSILPSKQIQVSKKAIVVGMGSVSARCASDSQFDRTVQARVALNASPITADHVCGSIFTANSGIGKDVSMPYSYVKTDEATNDTLTIEVDARTTGINPLRIINAYSLLAIALDVSED